MIFGGPGFAGGFIVGFGTGFVSRELVQFGASVARPVARTVIKASITAFERGRETIAQVGETFEDLVAEVRSNMAHRVQPAGVTVPASAAAASSTAASASESSDDKASSAASGTDEHRKKKGSHK